MAWQNTKNRDLEKLKEVRLQLHQASQMIAATGISFVDKKPDDSHTNMEWNNTLNAFLSAPFGSHNQLRLAINFEKFKIVLLDEDHDFLELKLHGKTEKKIVSWYLNALKSSNFDPSGFTLKRHYEIPLTKQAGGAAFDFFDPSLFADFAHHFANADLALKKCANQNPGSSDVRCWPHHFDLGMLITIEANENLEKMKSVGVGFSPGDYNYNEPYYYVSPWPYPDFSSLNNDDLPGGGKWHTEGFVSAILTATNFQKTDDQQEAVEEFLSKAIHLSKSLIKK